MRRIRNTLAQIKTSEDYYQQVFKAGDITKQQYDKVTEIIARDRAKLKVMSAGSIKLREKRREPIDDKKLAMAIIMMAEAQVREDRDLPPLTAEESKADLEMHQEVMIQVEAREREKGREQADKRRKRFHSNKPAALRHSTWQWLINQGVDEKPEGSYGPIAYDHGIASQLELIRDTTIQFPDGINYVITRRGAADLVNGRDEITLRRYDGEELVSKPRSEVLTAIAEGPRFEQIP